MANFFKKKGGGQIATSGIQMNDSEAALAQSDFNIEKITEVQNRFTGGMILLYPGRIFIREGLLWKVCRKGPKKRQFFLFNDILVYGSVVANRYSNQHILPLSQMSVSAECFYQPRVNADFDEESEQTELDVGNAFQISHANKSFHVFALSSADKANWLANLHKHINRVSQSLSSDNQLVTKPVWVPDSMSKECMVCSVKFTAFIRKHHCRRCGRVVCTACSPHRMSLNTEISQGLLLDTKKLERVCKDCFKDMSSANIRVGGSQIQQPPPAAIAAQVVSSVLQSTSISKTMESSMFKEDRNSSTDTEDSDDSGNEQVAVNPESAYTENFDQVSLPEKESQPTPPPRKKKLKKKLEQSVENKLDKDFPERSVPSEVTPSELELSQKDSDNNSVAQNVISDGEGKLVGADVSETVVLDHAKKSRRRKKHLQVKGSEDVKSSDSNNGTRSSQADQNEQGNEEDQSELEGTGTGLTDKSAGEESDTKKIRSRRTKFK